MIVYECVEMNTRKDQIQSENTLLMPYACVMENCYEAVDPTQRGID
jgi:hypothetical protein